MNEELLQNDKWVLQQYQQLVTNLKTYTEGHRKQMEVIQQRKS